MKVLAIDCSAKSVSVAIAEDGKLISEGFLNIKLTHSETLMPIMEQVLSNARLTLEDLDAFAVTAGPGSFTGIRIGISAIKGLAFAENKPVFAFSTLEAMPLSVLGLTNYPCTVCSLMDARRNQFYNAIFSVEDGEVIRVTEDRTIDAAELRYELMEMECPILLMGDGAELFYSLAGNELFCLAPEPIRIQRAAGIAVKASADASLSPVSPDALQVIYLRKSQAEREREEKLK